MGANLSGLGIEFLLVGPAKAGKTTVARLLAARHGGAYFNLSVFNRIIAWKVLKSRNNGNAIDLSRQVEFSARLAELASNVDFDSSGRVLYRGQDISDEIETVPVSLQAAAQSELIYGSYREQLTPVIWEAIARLKSSGPVFVVARRRRSVRTARRAVYLDASRGERATRLQASETTLTHPEAYDLLLRRDLSERTFLEIDECDAVVDSSGQDVRQTVDAVSTEFEKAQLIAAGNFYGLRPLAALDRTTGQALLEERLRGRNSFLLCCADLDYQGMLKNAFGKQVDLLSYLLSALSSAAREYGGIPIIWGSDDILVLFPYRGGQGEALALLDRVRHAYLCGNAGKLGVGVITGRNGQAQAPSSQEIVMCGEFTGHFGGEDLFPFEVRPGVSLDTAFQVRLDDLNSQLARIGTVLSGHPKCVVPASTVTLGGVLVEGTSTALAAVDLVDAAYGAMQDAKSQGKNCSHLFRLDELDAGYRFRGQALVADASTVDEISRPPGGRFVISKADRREHYPRFHNVTALERLVTSWLRQSSVRDRSAILLYPGFAGGAIVNALKRLAEAGEVPVDAPTTWVLPHGYWFKALSRVYSQQNRDILIRAAAHFQDLAVRDWVRSLNRRRITGGKVRLARAANLPLRGLRLALECIWFFEGRFDDADALLLLRKAQERLAAKLPDLTVKVLGITAVLDRAWSARDVLRQVDVFRQFVMDPLHHLSDPYGNVLVRVEITDEDKQNAEDREEAQQAENLSFLSESRGDIKGLALFCALDRELWRCYRRVANALPAACGEEMVRTLGLARLLRWLEAWTATEVAALLHYLLSSNSTQAAFARVLNACTSHPLRERVRPLLPAASLAALEGDPVRTAEGPIETLDFLLRAVSANVLAPFGFAGLPEPCRNESTWRELRETLDQATECAHYVWGEDANKVVGQLAKRS